MANRPLLISFSLIALTSCRGGPPGPPATNTYISMAPSNTELLYCIGANDHLAGICTQCDYPPAVKSLPRVGNFETPDIEKLATIRPAQAFLVDGQETMASMIEKQTAFKTTVSIIKNKSIDDIAKNTLSLGTATNHIPDAQRAAKSFTDQVNSLRQLISSSATNHPKVFFCVWPEPLVAVGRDSYLHDAVTICGGTNISANLPGAYGRFNLEKLVVEQPDVIIMPNEAERGVFDRAPWSSLEAVKKQRLYFLPPRAEDRLSRPTLRLVDGLYWLAEHIHPELKNKISLARRGGPPGPPASMNKNSMSHLSTTSPAKP